MVWICVEESRKKKSETLGSKEDLRTQMLTVIANGAFKMNDWT